MPRCYRPTVTRFVDGTPREVDSELHAELVKLGIGGTMRFYASAPGCGHVDEYIIRIDRDGVHTVQIANTVRELDPSEVV